MTFDVDRLLASYARVDRLSLPSTLEQTGVHDGYRQTQLVAPFTWVLEHFLPVKSAWLSVIGPGGFIRPHRDAGPWLERWQVPIVPAGRFIQDGVELAQAAGKPFQVFHWLTHEVVNDTDHDRVHLVVDRNIVLRPGSDGFEVMD